MTPNNSSHYDVFISYSHQDQDWVRRELLPLLEKERLRVCIDFRDFRFGAPLLKEMEIAALRSRKTLLILTPAYLESEHAEFESMITHSFDPAARKRSLIPVLLKTCNLPRRYRALMYVDLTDPSLVDIGLQRLVESLKTKRSRKSGSRFSSLLETMTKPEIDQHFFQSLSEKLVEVAPTPKQNVGVGAQPATFQTVSQCEGVQMTNISVSKQSFSLWTEEQCQWFENLSLDEAVEEIKQSILTRFPNGDMNIVDRAFNLANEKHVDRFQKSGRPEIRHLLAVTKTMADIGLDPESVAAATLHDIIEDRQVSEIVLRQMFGGRVASLVNAVSRQKNISTHSEADLQRSVFKKVLDSLINGLDDLPAVFIKLAERLDHMRYSIQKLPFDQRQDMARETIEGYAPLAERLGIWELKASLEDLAFKSLQPEIYWRLVQQLESQRSKMEAFLHKAIMTLELELAKANIPAVVEARIGHYYSTYEKMRRKGRRFAGIHDLIGIRVIVDQENQCYSALEIVHRLWKPIAYEFDDYIHPPKPNGYQSLHTTVLPGEEFALEVQIRTRKMHELAEFGLAAHWRYKGTGDAKDEVLNTQFTALQKHLESSRQIRDVKEYIKNLSVDLLQEQIHVYYTPTGQLVSLPRLSTPVDLAYSIGPEIAEKCVRARVNEDDYVSLNWQLKTGDRVTILTSADLHGPEREWFTFVRTSLAKEAIRNYFQGHPKELNAREGWLILQRELKMLGVNLSLEDVARQAGNLQAEDLLGHVGACQINARDVAMFIFRKPYRERILADWTKQAIRHSKGLSRKSITIAECCNPDLGDQLETMVVGPTVFVHKSDCDILREQPNKKSKLPRIDPAEVVNVTRIRICTKDRIGLLNEITGIFSAENVNIIKTEQISDLDAEQAIMGLEISSPYSLNTLELLHKLELIPDVIEVQRVDLPQKTRFMWKISAEHILLGLDRHISYTHAKSGTQTGTPIESIFRVSPGQGFDKYELRLAMDKTLEMKDLVLVCANLEEDFSSNGISLPVRLDLFGAGRTRSALILELIEYLDRRGYLSKLIEALSHVHPGILEVYSPESKQIPNK